MFIYKLMFFGRKWSYLTLLSVISLDFFSPSSMVTDYRTCVGVDVQENYPTILDNYQITSKACVIELEVTSDS
jgi:hypothetical protein